MTAPTHAKILTTVLLAAAAVSCRAGSGERCICADDCRTGLVCAIDGGKILKQDECAPGGIAKGGTCIPEDDIPDPSGGPMSTGPYMDLGSKLDLDPDPSTSSTTATGSDTGSGSDTSTSTGSSTGSGT